MVKAQKVARVFYAKHIEISVALNQNIEMLLAGTVKQIRLVEEKTATEKTKVLEKKRASVQASGILLKKKSFIERIEQLFACGIWRKRSTCNVSNLFVDSQPKRR
ncbi:hypothetical protein ACOME3_002692 [Neoechinorhynchus agilis]